MNQRCFIDTNVLVYAYSKQNKRKQQSAVALLEQILDQQAVISTQVVNEFCNVMLTKQGVLMDPEDLAVVLRDVLEPIMQHVPSLQFYESAIRLYRDHAISFYDSLVIQAALDLRCDVLYSEDLQDGQKFGKLTVSNPFKLEAS